MTQIPKGYDPTKDTRPKNMPEGVNRVFIEQARVEKDKYDKLNQRENVCMKVRLVKTNEIFWKRFAIPISWTIPGASEERTFANIQGRHVATMLELVGGFEAGGQLNAPALDGKEFMWDVSHWTNPKNERVTDNINNITLPPIGSTPTVSPNTGEVTPPPEQQKFPENEQLKPPDYGIDSVPF